MTSYTLASIPQSDIHTSANSNYDREKKSPGVARRETLRGGREAEMRKNQSSGRKVTGNATEKCRKVTWEGMSKKR